MLVSIHFNYCKIQNTTWFDDSFPDGKNYILKRNHLSYITLSERIVLRHLFAADGTETLFLRLRKRKNQVNTYYHIEIRRGKEAQEFKESKNTI